MSNQLVPKGSEVPKNKSAQPSLECLGLTIAEDNVLLREQLTVILSLLHGLSRNILNGDMMVLAIYSAKDTAVGLGCSPETVNKLLDAYLDYYRKQRTRNPLAKFFPEP